MHTWYCELAFFTERILLDGDEEEMTQDIITAKAVAPTLLTTLLLINCWPKNKRRWKERAESMVAEEKQNFALIPKEEALYAQRVMHG